MKKAGSDLVNQPSHYLNGSIECIDSMVAAFGVERTQTYAEIAAFKYLWRMNKKNIWYLRFSIGDDPRRDKDGI